MLLKIGGRVKAEVFLKDPPIVFYTTVRKCDNETIELSAPIAMGKRIGVVDGARVLVTEASSSGLLILDTSIVRMETEPDLCWVLRAPTIQNIRKIQRRREVRYLVDLHVKSRTPKDAREETLLHLINVNTLGALIATETPLSLGEEVMLDLTPLVKVSGYLIEQRFNVVGKVVREVGDQGRVYGIQFDKLDRVNKGRMIEALRRLKSLTE